MRYAVNVSWSVFGTLYLDAKDDAEARLLADAMPLPDSEYIGDSFKIDGVQVDEDAVVIPSCVQSRAEWLADVLAPERDLLK